MVLPRRSSPKLVSAICVLCTFWIAACGDSVSEPEPIDVQRGALNGTNYQQKLIVPGYFDPTSRGVLAGTTYQGFAIANFGSPGGPGSSRVQSDADWIASLEAKGILVLGYVDNPYLRLGGDITTDVSNWIAWYPVNGIFFDDSQRTASEATTTDFDTARMEYLQNYVSGAIGTTAPVAFNWGQTGSLQRYVYCSQNVGGHPAPMFSTLEGPDVSPPGLNNGFDMATFPAWVTQYQPTTFFNLIYGANSNGMTIAADMSKSRTMANAAAIYVTDDNLPNPWDQIAGYSASPPTNMWSQEISLSASHGDYPSVTALTPFSCPAAQLDQWTVVPVTTALL
jgi:hypothetical protein